MARSRKSRYAASYRLQLSMLIAARHKAGLTQEEIAERMGTSQSMLSKLERGVVRMDVLDVFDYLRALDADPIEFMKVFASRMTRH